MATLNGLHPSLKFTMELPSENTIPFIGIQIIKNGTELETRVYRKPTNTGLLLHFQSHVDKRYKTGLLKTMLHRAHALSSTTEAFNEVEISFSNLAVLGNTSESSSSRAAVTPCGCMKQ